MNSLRLSLFAMVAIVVFNTAANANSELLEKGKMEGLSLAFITEPPYTYLDDSGNPAGLINEIGLGAAENLGVKLNPLLVEWSTIIPGVLSGRFDIGQGMYVTAERCKQVAFSKPLYREVIALLVRAGNPKQLKSYDDILANEDVKLALLAGGVSGQFAEAAGVDRSQIISLPDRTAMSQALISGRADALTLAPGSVNQLAAASGGKLERVKDFQVPDFAISYISFAFSKDNADFVQEFDKALEAYQATPAYLDALRTAGYDKSAKVGDITIAELCK